jgi:hypothetical protein
MKLTKKQQWITLGVVIATSGLLMDRFVIGYDLNEPTSSAAAETIDPIANPGGITPSASTHTPNTAALAAHLEKFSQQPGMSTDQIKDAFRPPASWLTQQTNPSHSGPVIATQDPNARFQQKHRLEAVMISSTSAYAILDGEKIIRPGQAFDGFKLLAITPSTARFENNRETIELFLANDSIPAP